VWKEPKVLGLTRIWTKTIYFSDFTASLIFSNIFFLIILVLYDNNRYVTFFIDYIFSSIKKMNDKYLEIDSSLPLTFVFLYINVLNLIGCFLFYPITSFPTVPFLFSFILFFYSIAKGIKYKGARVFTDLVPSHMPFVFKVLFFPLELLSAFLRPLSLSVRLLANIFIGHFVYHILCSVVEQLTKLVPANFRWFADLVGISLLTFINLIDIFKAILQACLFCLFSILMMKNFVGSH
jgi:F0F1-type ATP synthase membrane subunit a